MNHTLKFSRLDLNTCSQATGIVVVIDVIRAFSTAAYALAAGAEEILLVSGLEEARQLKASLPGSLIVGEEQGLPVAGFDFCNSPLEMLGVDFRGRTLIQRTSAGTQGVVRSTRAAALLGSSLVVAEATAACIHRLAAGHADAQVTFVLTGQRPGGFGDEDAACADLLEARLTGQPVDLGEIERRVRQSPWGQVFADPQRAEFPIQDLELCLAVDRFNFALPVIRRDRHLVLRAANGC